MTLDGWPLLLTPEEVARITRRGRNQVYADLQAGRLPAVRLGRSWRVPREALERLLSTTTADVETPA